MNKLNSKSKEVMAMRKLLASALLAAAALGFHSLEASDPSWAYAYITASQTLNSTDPVTWNGNNGTFSEGVFLSFDDPTLLVIKHPGIYIVSYSTTVEVVTPNSDQGDAQFALFLNENIVPGSIYGVGNAFSSDFITSVFTGAGMSGSFDTETQCNGQVIVKVKDHNSVLSLKNHCENTLSLSATAGTDELQVWGNNVAASIAIQKIDKLED
jgi:hypothetical protein